MNANSGAKVSGGKWRASRPDSGTKTNLKVPHSVVMSRQFARPSVPSMMRDCAP